MRLASLCVLVTQAAALSAPRPRVAVVGPAGDTVADAVAVGLANDEFLILPHPEVVRYEQRRAGDRARWLAGMQKLQASLPGS